MHCKSLEKLVRYSGCAGKIISKNFASLLALLWGIPYNNAHRKEVVKLEEFAREITIAMIGVIAAKAVDELVEALKKKARKKTPEKRGK